MLQGEEKAAADTENEKDKATEKEEAPAVAAPVENGAGDVPEVEEKQAEAEKPAAESDSAIDTTATSLNESKEVVEGGEGDAATPNTDSAKKAKKEKSKKRFLSFRSFSFSKKDKQKPKKAEEVAATNGECEKVPEEVIYFAQFPSAFSRFSESPHYMKNSSSEWANELASRGCVDVQSSFVRSLTN